MKKAIWIIIVCLAVVALLCACQGKDEGGDAVTNGVGETLAEFEGLSFENVSVEYDGAQHEVLVTGAPSDAKIAYQTNKGTMPGTYQAKATVSKAGYKDKTLTATLEIKMPSPESVIQARANANASYKVTYDFELNLQGTLNIAGYSGQANGKYQGSYRFDKSTGKVEFRRTTSGLLLPDSTEYIMDLDGTRLKVGQNKDGKVNSIEVAQSDMEELILINKPFAALVDAIKANELQNIRLTSGGNYAFVADIRLSTGNPIVDKLLSVVAKQGSNLSFKGVNFTNPVNGLKLYFNLGKDKQLNDFAFGADISFPVKGVPVALSLDYSQKAAQSTIALPNIQKVIVDRNQITTEMGVINDALTALGQSNDYSLDLTAYNQFDPGWNVRATVDKYIARMYKHTYDLDGDPFVAFNHSYEFKTHHEDDGAETYKYTIGNIQDGTAHLVSRKGSNTITELSGVNADTQFDYLTGEFRFLADDVDCIQKEVSGGVTKYVVYLRSSTTTSINDKVIGLINSNQADGVIEVNNFFDSSDYLVKESTLTFTLNSGKVESINAETEMKYNPIAGEYSDKRITLTNRLTLEVNKKLSDAKEYTAPKSTTTKIGAYGLNNSKYYIL